MQLYAAVWVLAAFCVVSGTELHHQLTRQERLRFFGTESTVNVPVYQTIFARPHAIHKRSLLPNRDLFYHVTVEGKNRTLHLQPNRNLISPHFILKPDSWDVNMTSVGECLFHGTFTSGPGRAAVSTCGELGLTGMIETEAGQRYQLHPAPARFQENITNQGHMHFLVPTKNESSNETFCGVHELNVPQRLVVSEEMNMTSSRRRRDVIRDVIRDVTAEKLYIETAVFADYMLYKTLVGKTLLHDHDAFVKYILAIVNTVQLVYNEASLGRSVEIVLVRLEILQNENLPFYNEEVDKYLWDFCKWQSNLNPGTDLSTPSHWDHAIILTGFDLRSGSMRSVTGYAPVGGMCNPLYSCTINEGNHFGAAFVIAHEMGHSLTMQHDGQAGVSGNGCDAQRYLMSPSTGRGKTTWSTCSRNYVDAFLSSTQSVCLKDKPPGIALHPPIDVSSDVSNANLPGQMYPADDQCKLLYGLEFHRYTTQPSSDVCEILICANTTVYITGHPALPGTFCGEGHWCSGGKCVPWGSTGPMAIDGGWKAWPSETECFSECLIKGSGFRVFERSCTNPTPANGGKPCQGKSKRYRMCEDSTVCRTRTLSTIGNYANKQCLTTKTTQNDATLTGAGRQRLQDPTGGCVIWCDTFQGGYKTWGAKFPDGTDCGSGFGSRAFCVDGQCQGFGCDGWTLDESSPDSCFVPTNTTTAPTTQAASADSTVSPVMPVTFPAFFPVPRVLLFPNSNQFLAPRDSWGPWGPWGPWESSGLCVSNCLQDSVALQKMVRKCQRGSCTGRNTTVSLCPVNCPSVFYTADSYVTKICTALKTVDQTLSGFGKQLPDVPEDKKQACKLWCQTGVNGLNGVNGVNGLNGVNGVNGVNLRSWPEMFFPDGTLCAADVVSKSYCVKGTCTRFNCEGKPVDPSDSPKCEEQSSLKLLLPLTSPVKSLMTSVVTSVVTSGKPSMIQQAQSGKIPSFGDSSHGTVRFQWMTVSTPCSTSCGGGVRRNHVQCTDVGQSSFKLNHKVNEVMCQLEVRPAIAYEESCNTQSCPQWSASKWSECSGDCGNWTMTRLVQCIERSAPLGNVGSSPLGNITVETILNDALCDALLKPPTSQNCTLTSPCPDHASQNCTLTSPCSGHASLVSL